MIKLLEKEKIFYKSHIHIVYIIFIYLYKEYDYKIISLILYDLSEKLSKITNIK